MSKPTRLSAIVSIALAAALTAPAAHSGDLPSATPTPAVEQAYWSTPGDGTLTLLLRNKLGFQNPIPFRARVCVTNFTGLANAVNLIVWTTPGYVTNISSQQEPQTHTLALGECAEIDQPAAIIVQDSTTSGIASGYYQILERTAPPLAFLNTVGAPAPAPARVPKRHEHDVKVGEPKSISVACAPYPDGAAGGAFPPVSGPAPNGDYYARYCWLKFADFATKPPLPPTRGARICTDGNYVDSGNKYGTVYAISLLDLVADKDAVGTEKDSPYNYNFNPLTGNSCRDIFYAGDLFFMVGPGSHGQYWDAANVNAIQVTVEPLSWADKDPR